MPFDKGSVNATFFELAGELPENLVECFAGRHAGSLDGLTDEPQIGWVSGRHLLDNQITEANALRGDFCHVTLRKAERKIPSSLLNALCKQEEYVLQKANNWEYVSRKEQKKIREDIIERNLKNMPPSLSGIQVVAAPREQAVFVGASSQTQLDLFVENFLKTTGVDPRQESAGYLLEKFFQTTESGFPKLCFSDNSDDEPALGRDFLTWLWFYSETAGVVTHPEFGEFDLLIEGPLTFAFSPEARGAAETVIKKGEAPLRSAEAKAALAVGKKLKKAKFSLTRGNDVWSGTLDADRFAVSSLKLPEGEAMEDEDRFEERMENLLVFRAALQCYFRKFGELLLTPKFEEYQKTIRRWAADRDGI